jgi:hypothetical protein
MTEYTTGVISNTDKDSIKIFKEMVGGSRENEKDSLIG